MRIKLPASITGATAEQAKGKHGKREHAVREIQPTGRANLSRRPTAAPRRSSY
ncbi:hypothetical protein [Nonomuraea typhae]|uniref:hypothetical protein n=1 Tax=Nonomuraea typhae TaxID=2603600 RepID=UPI0015E1FA1B|nr:hypothetical protein [Nonomuraea typhae]